MHICLDQRSVQGFDLSYKQVDGLPEELWNLLKSYFCGNSKRSSILEFYRRMTYARQQFLKRNKGLSKRKQKKLITLQECYTLHESFEVDGDIKRSSSSLLTYVLVAIFISIEIGLLLRLKVRYFESLATNEKF